MHKIYIKFDDDNNFNGFGVQLLQQNQKYKKVIIIENGEEKEILEPNGFDIVEIDSLPDKSMIITEVQHEEYLTALNSQLKNIVLVDNEVKVIDKYTPEELLAKEQENLKQQQAAESHSLLSRSIQLESGAYQRRMSTEEKIEFEAWQDALLDFIDGNSETLPLQPEFINTLLGA